jgi:hypothetical protein
MAASAVAGNRIFGMSQKRPLVLGTPSRDGYNRSL